MVMSLHPMHIHVVEDFSYIDIIVSCEGVEVSTGCVLWTRIALNLALVKGALMPRIEQSSVLAPYTRQR